MIATLFLFCSLALTESKTLALQICLDRAGFSCNAIDGQWGRKSQSALAHYCTANALPLPPTPEEAYDRFFSGEKNLFRIVSLRDEDLAACVHLPDTPAEKAKLSRMGYPSIVDLLAERGHLTRQTLKRLNPGVDWAAPFSGLRLVIPDFPPISEELSVWPKDRPRAPQRPEAALIKISLSEFQITVFDGNGRLLALFPCSIAKNKTNLPSRDTLKIITQIAHPNYTYTAPSRGPGEKQARYIFPPGPRCPVGVVWLGLDLPGYGIHGTPTPETIGRAESHGCFRLSNWNAARLYALCPVGTRVIIVR
jgi:lipoprotein-anchoring transpeptidase ErfK/SrfK